MNSLWPVGSAGQLSAVLLSPSGSLQADQSDSSQRPAPGITHNPAHIKLQAKQVTLQWSPGHVLGQTPEKKAVYLYYSHPPNTAQHVFVKGYFNSSFEALTLILLQAFHQADSSLLFDLLVYMPFLIMHGGTLKALLWNVSLETCSIVKGAWGSHLEGFLGWCLSQNSGDMRVHWLAGLSRL